MKIPPRIVRIPAILIAAFILLCFIVPHFAHCEMRGSTICEEAWAQPFAGWADLIGYSSILILPIFIWMGLVAFGLLCALYELELLINPPSKKNSEL